MGFRFRKSINLGGGFRINLSKSGVGYSWGTKGYRITKTARGTTRRTASIPGTGISYSTETKKVRHNNASSKAIQEMPQSKPAIPTWKDSSDNAITNVQAIESADVETMRPAEYSDLFAATKKLNTIFWVLIAAIIVSLFISPVISLLFVVCTLWFVCTQHVYLDYDFDEYALANWEKQKTAWDNLAKCKSLWYITTTATVNKKTNAGATSGAELTPAKISKSLPWFLKSDIKPLIISLKTQKLIFMPDRLLVLSGAKLGAVSYSDIQFQFGVQPYAGEIQVPKETEIMEYRWLKVNKNGTPDKRFKGNRQIPVYKLGRMNMKSASGLNVSLLSSRVSPVEELEKMFS